MLIGVEYLGSCIFNDNAGRYKSCTGRLHRNAEQLARRPPISRKVATVFIAYFIYAFFIYECEMNQIKDDLNEIEDVQVLGIWGHEDITLEEISARLQIKGKGEIVLYGLSADVFNYPKNVNITEIGGFSFTSFSCNGGIGGNWYRH